jgi:hypothetical protein
VDSRYGQGSARYTDAYLTALSSVQNGSYSTYADADTNMAYAEHYIAASGLTLYWENTTGSYEIGEAQAEYSDLTSATSAPRALLYGGWYNYGRYLDVWEWLPGSVACDLNSNSLSNLRSPATAAFGTQALRKGASAFCGVIGEPYLNGHPRPNVLLYYILNGYCFAEAAALCTPSIGWMPINVGDALYAPLAAKTLVYDTQPPALEDGYPQISFSVSGDPIIKLLVADAPEPDLAKIQIEYGLTAAYGMSKNSEPGFWRRHSFVLEGLASMQTYHFRLRLEDPAGNIAYTTDAEFTTGVVLTPTPTRTATPTRTYTPTPSATMVLSPTQSPTATIATTRTVTPTITLSPTVSPTASISPTISPTATVTSTATITPTSTASPTTTLTPTATPTNPLSQIDLAGKPALAYPNPGKNDIRFLLHLSRTSHVVISIYNINGERIAVLEQTLNGRGQVLHWQCTGVAPGIYIAAVVLDGELEGKLKVAITK